MTRILVIAAVLAAVMVAGALPPAPAQERTCLEDEPCWHWPTTGNRQRGVVLDNGRELVVGPCRFGRLDRRHRIDWEHTERLRGDRWARAHGCC